MNSGIQDSFNLAWKLALVQRKLAPYSLLQTYSDERLPVIKDMLERTTKILTYTFKDKTTEIWNKSGGLLQLGVNCRWSLIILDERKLAEEAEDADFEDFNFGNTEETPLDGVIDSYGTCAEGILRAGDRAPDASELVDLSRGSHGHSPIR